MRIQDRSKDVIKSGGEWIASIQLENAAMGHPKVGWQAALALQSNTGDNLIFCAPNSTRRLCCSKF